MKNGLSNINSNLGEVSSRLGRGLINKRRQWEGTLLFSTIPNWDECKQRPSYAFVHGKLCINACGLLLPIGARPA